MNKLIFFAFITIMFSCNPSQDNDFQRFYETFQGTMEEEPLIQALMEDRLFLDSFIVIPKKEEVLRLLALSKAQLGQLHTFETARLSPDLHQHHENLHIFLEMIIDKIAVKKTWQTQPSLYSVLPYLEFLSNEKDIEKLGIGFDQSAALFQTAIRNLDPVDIEKLQGSISESIATYEFLSTEMSTYIEALKAEKKEKKEVLQKLTLLKLELKNFIAFCNSKLFDLGNER